MPPPPDPAAAKDGPAPRREPEPPEKLFGIWWDDGSNGYWWRVKDGDKPGSSHLVVFTSREEGERKLTWINQSMGTLTEGTFTVALIAVAPPTFPDDLAER